MMAADGHFIYTGGEAIIPPGVTRVRIHESVTVIPANAFYENRTIEELECHDRVKTVKEEAFFRCRSLIFVIMPGEKAIERGAFNCCKALALVECGKLEIIGYEAFAGCESLTSIKLPSAKIVGSYAFSSCKSLTKVEFGKELKKIGYEAFYCCTSLERITIPLKDGIISDDDTFRGCKKLEQLDLVEGTVLSDTIDALLSDEWKIGMKDKLGVIDQILSTTPAGDWFRDDPGGKAQAVRMWIRSVLRNIVHYKAEHRRLLNEAATILQHAFPKDIVNKNDLPFLELPSHTFGGED